MTLKIEFVDGSRPFRITAPVDTVLSHIALHAEACPEAIKRIQITMRDNGDARRNGNRAGVGDDEDADEDSAIVNHSPPTGAEFLPDEHQCRLTKMLSIFQYRYGGKL